MSSEFVVQSAYNKQPSDRRSPAWYIFSHIKRHPLVAIMLMIGAISNAALAALLFYFIGTAYNAAIDWQRGIITREEAFSAIVGVVTIIVISQLIRASLMFARNYSAEMYGQRVERDVRDELYSSLLGKSMDFHDKRSIGEIMARVTNDVRELNLMMNPGLNLIFGSGMFLIMPLIYTPLISWQLTIVPVLFTITYVIAQYQYVSSLHRVAQDVRRTFGEMNANLAESLDGVEIVKGAAQEDSEVEKFNQQVDHVYKKFVEQGDIEAFYLPLLIWGIAMVFGFAHSLYLANIGTIVPGDVVRFMGYMSLFGFPVFVSQFAFSQLALGYASARRIVSILNTESTLDQNKGGHSALMAGAVTFDNVSFHYDEGKVIIHGVAFDVEPGQTVALVGQTGAGKSTVTKLMNRTYDVTDGSVSIDSVNVKEWDLQSLRSQISIIEQDVFLFSRTIAENIAFGVEGATQVDIEQAARMAQAHDFITSFPEGYQTVIGQRGVTLSGGQRQRLAIARAFLTDPKILILDDSTSAIDSATEDKIQRAIWAAAEGRTTILITHRLSQIRWADHIVVIKKGRVVAQGKHEDLLGTSDAYRRIFARYENPVRAGAPASPVGD